MPLSLDFPPLYLARQGIYSGAGLRQIVCVVKLPTFADKLGTATHESTLLQKVRRLGFQTPEWLENIAVARGCWHYRSPDFVSAPVVSELEFSNEELAVALLSPSLPYSPHTIRIGAAMLGATGNGVATLVRLATAEGCVAPVRYIAEAALRYEPENPFWRQLLNLLPTSPPIKEGVMPHPTRFVSMAGMNRSGLRLTTVWIRPRPDLALVRG